MHGGFTIVVPTRNRVRSVRRLLDSLASTRDDAHAFEVVVVDDGSTDGTPASLAAGTWPFPLRLVQQQNAGAAVARNAGAREAAGDLLLFLDDDVQPAPGLLAAHARAHAGESDIVAIGDLPPVVDDSRFLGVMLRYWWGSMQDAVRRPGHRYAFTDLLSGHCSIRRAPFERLGGFDERLRCREDYEFGYRAIAAGLRLQFVPDAVAWHHDDADLRKVMRRKYDEGTADVHLAICHPGLALSLPLRYSVPEGRMARRLMHLAWHRPRTGDAAARTLAALLPALEAVRLRWRWQAVLHALLTYWYWRGVARTATSTTRWQALLDAARRPGQAPMTLDLADGLEAAEERLDRTAPPGLRLVYGDTVIGEVPVTPGAEPLRGRHLRPLLATEYRNRYLAALLDAGAIPGPLRAAAADVVSAGAVPPDRAAAV